MRLINDKEQGLRICLAALKNQQQAVMRHIEEVQRLLRSLEAEDDQQVAHRTSRPAATPYANPSRFSSGLRPEGHNVST